MATKTCPTEMEDRTNLVGKMVILKYTHFEYINRYTHKYMSVFMYTRVCIATSNIGWRCTFLVWCGKPFHIQEVMCFSF